MPITAPPTIPLITDPSTFSVRAQDWVVWQAEELYPEIVLQSALLGLSLSGSSVTSNTIGTGSKSFTVETGKGFAAGVSLVIADSITPTNRMFGLVDTYNSGTGALVFISQSFEGSGTFTDWAISPTLNAVITTSQIADLAVTNAKLSEQYINDLTEVEFDYGNDFVAISDGSDAGNKKKAKLSASTIVDVDASVATNALTLTINPTTLSFRSTTLTDGSTVVVSTTTSKTLVIPETATLGTSNAVAASLAILAINNAGTIETAVINMAGGIELNEKGLISTTAISAASDANNVAYSTVARTNVAYRVVGVIEITQATAGTWATAPSLVQGFGGLALSPPTTGSLIGYRIFTASGSYTKATNNPSFVIVEVVGGGGNGGGGGSGSSSGSGGGAGGYAMEKIPASSLSASETVTVGAAAGTSSFGSLLSATGGSSGVSSPTASSGGTGGVGSGGDLNIKGQGGGAGIYVAAGTIFITGSGGSSKFGGGGRGVAATNTAAGESAGANTGAGGSGAATAGAGGNGGTGLVIVWEYR